MDLNLRQKIALVTGSTAGIGKAIATSLAREGAIVIVNGKTARPSSLLQRFATTEEVASLVTYVASPLASATNGAALRVDGGVIKTAY